MLKTVPNIFQNAGNDLLTAPTRVIDNHNLINPDKLENI